MGLDGVFEEDDEATDMKYNIPKRAARISSARFIQDPVGGKWRISGRIGVKDTEVERNFGTM